MSQSQQPETRIKADQRYRIAREVEKMGPKKRRTLYMSQAAKEIAETVGFDVSWQNVRSAARMAGVKDFKGMRRQRATTDAPLRDMAKDLVRVLDSLGETASDRVREFAGV